MRVIAQRPASEKYLAATTELLRVVSSLHCAVSDWHLGKFMTTQHEYYVAMPNEQRRVFVALERRLARQARQARETREWERDGMSDAQRLREKLYTDSRLEQAHL